MGIEYIIFIRYRWNMFLDFFRGLYDGDYYWNYTCHYCTNYNKPYYAEKGIR
jgi:esterase/lipase superfamily enzyme